MRDYAGLLPVYLEDDLYRSGWNGAVLPYPGISRHQYLLQSIRRSIVKKFIPSDTRLPDARALDLFLKINKQAEEFSLDTSKISEIEAIALGEAKDFISRFFSYGDSESGNKSILGLHEITDGFGLGNGANIGSFGTDFLSKIGTSTMAATDRSLHMYYMQAISPYRVWTDVESIRLVNRGCEIVRGGRLSFVPKTAEISRTICTEPILNMLFQKGIANVLERRLEQVSGINLSIQPDKNRKLAQIGSKSGKFGTIDLSSASDSMSLNLVREFFPRHVCSWLELTRSPIAVLPDGREVTLHMVSSMGNAFTFPLQTLFFLSLVYGVYQARSIHMEMPRGRALGNFAVFGDDIIVDNEAYDLVTRLLSLCGFSVNVDKSFNEGEFRESCGRDYFYGYNVRGVYVKTLRTLCDRYSAINRLLVWSSNHGVPLYSTISFLLEGTKKLYVPFDEMDTAGLKVPCSMLKEKSFSKYTGGILYRYLHIVPFSIKLSDRGLASRLRGWAKYPNPPAILLAALAGTLRKSQVVLRSTEQPPTRVKKRYSSRWDYIPFDPDYCQGFDSRWKSTVELALS